MRRRDPGGIIKQLVALPVWVAPITLYVVAVLVYTLLSRRVPLPELFGDELIYGNIAQSVAHGDGFTWRDASTGLTTLLYPLSIAPAWVLSDGVGAYQLAKTINAAVMCLAVFPIWLLAKRFVSPALALTVSGLTVGGIWFEASSKMMTESLAFPWALSAIGATVMACRTPDADLEKPRRSGQWWIWTALALGTTVAAVRLQLVALPLVTILALCIDSWRRPPGERAEVFASRAAPIYIAAGVVVAVFIAVLVDGSLLGRFQVVRQFHPAIDDWAKWSVYQLLALVVASGIVPFVVALALAIRPASWRDPVIGPLLTVVVALAAVLVVVSGWFIASNSNATWMIERYVFYAVPLVILLCVVGVNRLGSRFAVASTVITALLMLSNPVTTNLWEVKSFLALNAGLDYINGPLNVSADIARVLFTLAVGCVVVCVRRKRRLWLVLAVTALVIGNASYRGWTGSDLNEQRAAAFGSTARDWVVKASDGPVGMVFYGSSDANLPQWIEFFNPSIENAYALPAATVPLDGAMCSVGVAADGLLTPPGNCPKLPGQLLVIGDGRATVSFRGGQVIADKGAAGRLVKVPPDPRLLATVGRQPCDRSISARCSGQVFVTSWLDAAADLTVVLRGPAQRQKLEVGRHTYLLEPGKTTAVRIPLQPGLQNVGLPTDWSQPTGATPALVRVDLDEGDGPVAIYAERPIH